MVVLPPTVPVPVLPEVEARPVATVEEGMVVAMEIRQDQEPSRLGGDPINMLRMAFVAASESLALQCRKEGFGHPSLHNSNDFPNSDSRTNFTLDCLFARTQNYLLCSQYLAQHASLEYTPHGAASLNGSLQSQGPCMVIFNRHTIDSVGPFAT